MPSGDANRRQDSRKSTQTEMKAGPGSRTRLSLRSAVSAAPIRGGEAEFFSAIPGCASYELVSGA